MPEVVRTPAPSATPPEARPEDDEAPTTDHTPAGLHERYRLLRLHAKGGLGQVWLARDTSLGRDVALKEVQPDCARDPHVRERFLKEARITGQLEHPGVVPVYELARRPGDDQPFYVMRFVRGRTLAEASRAYHDRRRQGQAGPLELRELLTAFVAVCQTVAYAHSRGVLHRDLKPPNVVLGDYGEVMVLDWGLARSEIFVASSHRLASTKPARMRGTREVSTAGAQRPAGTRIDQRCSLEEDIMRRLTLAAAAVCLLGGVNSARAGVIFDFNGNTLGGGSHWDAAPRIIDFGGGVMLERSLAGSLRFSLQGSSFQAYRDLFAWNVVPTVADFQAAVLAAFNAWTVPDPVTGLTTAVRFVADLLTAAQPMHRFRRLRI